MYLIIFDTPMASTTPTAHFFVEWAPVHLYSPVFCAIMLLVRTISAKDFPHIYNGRNLRKTPPTVATEGRRTLMLIYLCEEAVMTRNQQEYRD